MSLASGINHSHQPTSWVTREANLFRSDVQQVIGASVTVQDESLLHHGWEVITTYHGWGLPLKRHMDRPQGIVNFGWFIFAYNKRLLNGES